MLTEIEEGEFPSILRSKYPLGVFLKREDRPNLTFKRNIAALMGRTLSSQDIRDMASRESKVAFFNKEKVKGSQTPPAEKSNPSFEEKISPPKLSTICIVFSLNKSLDFQSKIFLKPKENCFPIIQSARSWIPEVIFFLSYRYFKSFRSKRLEQMMP